MKMHPKNKKIYKKPFIRKARMFVDFFYRKRNSFLDDEDLLQALYLSSWTV